MLPDAACDTADVIVHRYDDIRAADHRLPMWWLCTLYGAIGFAIGYWFYFRSLWVTTQMA